MPKLSIATAPDERLITRASEVVGINDKIKELVNDMFETMYNAEGLGLAAVQIGVLKRIFVMDIQLGDIKGGPVGYESTGKFCMINPEITELSDEQVILKEGCLSIPEQSHEIRRPKYLNCRNIRTLK